MNQHVEIKLAKQQIHSVLDALQHFLGDEELKLDMLEGETSLQEVASALLSANEDDEGIIAALDAQIDVRGLRKERVGARIEARKKAITSLMDCAMITSLKLPEATISLRTLKGLAKVVDVTELPPQFTICETHTRGNLEAIKEAVERGETIPGVVMTNGSSSLTIRRK